MPRRFDFAIVGAGMAGASLAAQLAPQGSVIMLEAEARPGYHATGRSAAFWTESYGGPQVQPLTTASGPYLRKHGFLSPRGALTLAQDHSAAELTSFSRGFAAQGVRMETLDRGALEQLVPGLRPSWTKGALEPDCCDIDVAALHQHYLALAGRTGAELRCKARVAQVAGTGSHWVITVADGTRISADIMINAAGAWADEIARVSDVQQIGITPYRRTIAQLRLATLVPPTLPLVLDIEERFYFKPERGQLWLSPHDETPCAPCDAAAEELDIALAIERLGTVTDWQVERVEHRWAGLRSFAPDRLPVYGFDPARPRFFWFAGQGGFGIQTAPAAAELAAQLILGKTGGTIDPAPFLPGRFGNR